MSGANSKMDPDDLLPPDVWTGAYFGPVVDQAGNIVPPADDADPDDEEMDQTPPFVLAMLGYDPKDIEQ